ncbi:unnamed protein product, partial [Pleuronectes platessa]
MPSQAQNLIPIENLWQDLKIAVHRRSPSNLTELHLFVAKKEWTNLPSLDVAKLKAIRMWMAAKYRHRQDVQQCIQEQRASMKEVLEDTRLVTPAREKEGCTGQDEERGVQIPQSEDY